MIKKHLAVFGLVLGLLAFANPARANEVSSASATVTCTGYMLTANAIDLTVGTAYTISFTFTLTPASGPATMVTGTINFTATSSTAMETTGPTEVPWPGGPLLTDVTVTGTATLTALFLPVPITINGSTSAMLTCSIDERMTGGGSIFVDSNTQVVINGGTDPFKVTHGFEIHCGAPPRHPNTLEVNWPDHKFHLETLTLGTCVCNPAFMPPDNPDAGFNEFIGAGTGKLDGVEGASIVFIFTDQGEPGTNDTEQMSIFPPGSTSPVLTFPQTNLTFGNQQAHRQGSGKVPPCTL